MSEVSDIKDMSESTDLNVTVSGIFPEGKTTLPAEVVINRMGSSLVLDLRLLVRDIIQEEKLNTEISQES